MFKVVIFSIIGGFHYSCDTIYKAIVLPVINAFNSMPEEIRWMLLDAICRIILIIILSIIMRQIDNYYIECMRFIKYGLIKHVCMFLKIKPLPEDLYSSLSLGPAIFDVDAEQHIPRLNSLDPRAIMLDNIVHKHLNNLSICPPIRNVFHVIFEGIGEFTVSISGKVSSKGAEQLPLIVNGSQHYVSRLHKEFPEALEYFFQGSKPIVELPVYTPTPIVELPVATHIPIYLPPSLAEAFPQIAQNFPGS